jgi:hypothetical protein
MLPCWQDPYHTFLHLNPPHHSNMIVQYSGPVKYKQGSDY